MRRVFPLGMFALLLSISTTVAQENRSETEKTIELDHGISFTLPKGWAEEDESDTRRGEKGRLVKEFVCGTKECKARTLETCSVVMFAENYDQGSDRDSLEALYGDPLTRYTRLRAVRIATSEDAEFRRMLAPMTIGPREWWVVETDARHNMKSGLFAETIIGGWRVRMSCKTCETGEIRHQGAMRMMESFVREPD